MVSQPSQATARPRGERDVLRLRDIGARAWLDIFKRAGKETLDDHMPMIASAVAYSSFFAIPSILLLAVGLFSLIASPDTVRELMDRFSTFMPSEATELLGDSLQRLVDQPATGLVVTAIAQRVAAARGVASSARTCRGAPPPPPRGAAAREPRRSSAP